MVFFDVLGGFGWCVGWWILSLSMLKLVCYDNLVDLVFFDVVCGYCCVLLVSCLFGWL